MLGLSELVLKDIRKYNPDEIEKFFETVEDPQDPCGINKLTVQNNVISIKPEDMGGDNNYNPGF